MHSRIFEISKKVIDKADFNDSFSYCESYFVGGIADYVSDSADRDDDLEWLENVLLDRIGEFVDFDKEEGSFIFKEGFKEEYFRPNFEKFKKMAEEITLEDFASSSLETYKLKVLMSDDFSFYFDEEGDLSNLDSFIRTGAIADVKYYIGGTVDYHC